MRSENTTAIPREWDTYEVTRGGNRNATEGNGKSLRANDTVMNGNKLQNWECERNGTETIARE